MTPSSTDHNQFALQAWEKPDNVMEVYLNDLYTAGQHRRITGNRLPVGFIGQLPVSMQIIGITSVKPSCLILSML